jgi:uroporphyrinogen decarboxylase
MHNDLFLRACRRQHTERTPVWMMRQAGRYLPEYRAVRARANFLTMVHTPELAAEVTVQPVDLVGVDAAILFCDILVVAEAMGMQWEMIESIGPKFPHPIRSKDDVHALRIADPGKELRYVMTAIETTKRMLGGRVPLIGFSGSPWTLAAYMIEGGGTANFKHSKAMMLDEPKTFGLLMKKIGETVRLYLEAQIAAGVDAVQIFDTWGGALTPDRYRQYSLESISEIVGKMHRTGQPVIVFSKGAHHSLTEIAQIGAEVVGLDWSVDMAEARRIIGDRVALQGNLDPSALYASPESIRREVKSVLGKFGPGPGHVFNLGHGILPDVLPDHARAMIRAVKEESVAFHR